MSVFDEYPNHTVPQIIGEILKEQDAKYPTAPLTLPEEAIEKLNWLHCTRTDKFWRMFSGSSSDLIAYRDGVAEIEIHTSQENIDQEKGERRKLRNQIDAWGKERLLANAHSYVAHLIVREKAVGYACNANEFDADRATEIIKEISAPSVDVKVAEWRGSFERGEDGER